MRGYGTRTAAVGVGLALAVATVGVALAGWLNNGTGSAKASAGTAAAVQILNVNLTGKALLPGRSGDLTIKVKNPNSFPVKVIRVEPNGTPVADNQHRVKGCVTTGVVFPATSGSTVVDWDLAAEESVEKTIFDGVRMTNASHNACQGATFTVPVRLIAQSNAS